MKLQEVTLGKNLSTPQIQLIFQTAAEVAAESGANKTTLGKAQDLISRKESIEQAYEVYLQEGPFGNIASKAAGLMKTGAEKVATATAPARQAIAQKAKDVGNELGNKVTVKKLQQAWDNLGRPKDIGSIYEILEDAGLDADLIQAVSVRSDIKIVKSKAASSDLEKLAAEIKKSGAAAVIKKQLSGVTAPAVKKTRTVKPKAV